MIDVMIKLLPGGKMPAYMSAGAAGLDCYAREGGKIAPVHSYKELCAVDGNFWSKPMTVIQRIKVPLGFALSLPDGYEAQIRPRSGLGAKNGIHVAMGTIDSDYTGEVSALLYNLGTEDFEWQAGDRICQLVIAPVARTVLHQVDELTVTARGESGFGSTGR